MYAALDTTHGRLSFRHLNALNSDDWYAAWDDVAQASGLTYIDAEWVAYPNLGVAAVEVGDEKGDMYLIIKKLTTFGVHGTLK